MNKALKPTGPYHDFWVLNKNDYPYDQYAEFEGRKDAPVRIEDDIILYIYDSLKWITPYSETKIDSNGLNLYGDTILESTGSKQLENVAQAWVQLWNNAPNDFVITGGYQFISDENGNAIDDGEYQQILINKQKILQTFNKLIEICRIASDENYYILHLGI